MRAYLYCGWLVGPLALVGCSQSVTPPSLQSLAGSGEVTLLCRETTTGEGRDIRACPDSENAIYDGEDRHTIALVTQNLRGEVAAVDLHTQTVLDADPWLPGKEFLPVGSMPVAIVSTPGSIASFVAVAEDRLEAIYALPTSCITAPLQRAGDDRAREVTLWSACRLPGRPGKMAIVADSTVDAAASNGAFRTTCSATSAGWWQEVSNEDQYRQDCPADLRKEELIAPVGRRKLLVTLPDQGLIALYDAQTILNLPAGSFDNCKPDSIVQLTDVVAPDPTPLDQMLPADLGLPLPTYNVQVPSDAESRPAGIALAGNKLYVADVGVPLIHTVDLTDTCNPHEEAPLRPVDFHDPTRVVLTSEVAVSGPTLAGRANHQRFLYAVDYDGPLTLAFDKIVTSRSLMVFDLGDGASKKPVLRPQVPELPFEPPDRILFESPIKKIQIVTHDAPAVDPVTKSAEIGVLCDPYPQDSGVGTLYRTASDFSKGAGPRKLRGIFGVVTLASGQVAAIDIEDWDAPCRRPKSNNPNLENADWLGCRHDPLLAGDWFVNNLDLTTSSVPTVTDEASCNVVEPHRLRSGRYFRTDSTVGTLAPSLSNFPRLSSPDSGDLPTGKGDAERKRPQMLAVHYADSLNCSPSQNPSFDFLNVSSTRYDQCDSQQDVVSTEPAIAENNSLILPLTQPRVYGSQENFSVTYEGTVVAARASGWLPLYASDAIASERSGLPIQQSTEILLRDPDARFCANGVEDYRIARETGQTSFGVSAAGDLDSFATAHADFVVFTSDFDPADPFFSAATAAAGSSPSAVNVGGYCPNIADPYKECLAWFGTQEIPKPTREFTILESQDDDLRLAPRGTTDPERSVALVHCCFHNVTTYEVRAGKQWVVKGGALFSRMVGGGDKVDCKKDKSKLRSKLRSRVFEIASSTPCALDASGKPISPSCAIGPVQAGAVEPCVTKDNPQRAVLPSEFASGVVPNECLFDSLKARFAIYRGMTPSERDMAFTWSVTGGFSPLTTTIASASVGFNVLPTDMVYSQALDAFVIVDGASGGINLIDLASFAPLGQPYL